MKVLAFVVLLVAHANAFKLTSIAEKLVPSFKTERIINGQNAIPHAAPYIISLGNNLLKHSHSCGGSIISKEWVLTAAHCIRKPTGMRVIAGLHLLSSIDKRTQSREVDFSKVHKEYKSGVGPYDIALLHVSEPFEFNEWVQPATLPYPDEMHSGKTHLYGWGKQQPLDSGAYNTLQAVETDIIELNKCQEVLPKGAPVHETNICSDSRQQSISACQGDSGGPLVIEHKGASAELIGIVSWVYVPCGRANYPSIYTRVSAYINWINNVQTAYYILYGQ